MVNMEFLMMLILQMMLELLWVSLLFCCCLGFWFVLVFLNSDCLLLASFAVYTTWTAERSFWVTIAVQLLYPAYN